MELKSKSVKLFCSVVETGSLLAAANQNALSPSAASRVISQLEERIGMALFKRDGKALSLTDDGMEFYRVASESMRAWRELEDFSQQRRLQKKQLRIAVLSRHCSDVIIPGVVKILKRHQKSLRVTMDVHSARDIYYTKYSHPFDVGFGTLLSTHDDLEKIALAHLPFRLVVPEDHRLAGRERVTKSDYADCEFVILSRDTLEEKTAQQLMPEGMSNVSAEVSSTQVALRFVKRGVGVHLTDALAARSVSADCRAIPVEDALTIPFYVFWPKTGSEPRPEVVECVTEICARIHNVGIALTDEGSRFLALESGH